MPFKSQAQRRFMYAKHPAIARRWASEYNETKRLPEHTRKSRRSAALKHMKRDY